MRVKNSFSNSYYIGSSETEIMLCSICRDVLIAQAQRHSGEQCIIKKKVRLISSWLRPKNQTQNIWLLLFFFELRIAEKCMYLMHSWKEKDKYFNSNNRYFPHLIFAVIFWFIINGSIKVKYDFHHHAVVFFWCSGSLVLHTSYLTVP